MKLIFSAKELISKYNLQFENRDPHFLKQDLWCLKCNPFHNQYFIRDKFSSERSVETYSEKTRQFYRKAPIRYVNKDAL